MPSTLIDVSPDFLPFGFATDFPQTRRMSLVQFLYRCVVKSYKARPKDEHNPFKWQPVIQSLDSQ
jgi:hypothetical protein